MRYVYKVSSGSYWFMMIISLFVLVSCSKEKITGVPHHTKILQSSINEIKDLYSYYKGDDVPLAFDSGFKAINIYGVVISNAASGNLPKGYLVIQDDKSGIAIVLSDPSTNSSFMQGDSVKVNVVDGVLTKIKGNMAIKNIRQSDITKLGTTSAEAIAVSLETLSKNFGTYHERLVKIVLANIVPEPTTGETYSGRKMLDDGSTNPGRVVLYSFPSSDLAKVEANANATYTGIAMYGPGEEGDKEMQIWLRNEHDISKTTIIPVNAPLVITGFLANPRGSDEKYKGQKTHYGATGVTIIHKGGYEYIQLMALEDIDFSKTPYSVVTANNGTVTDKGWAEGGDRTFKFNLTEGTADAGTFFYVGATAKVICAYWPEGLSTDISDANWIRSIPVKLEDGGLAGDGFGNSTGGLLGNSSSADGIAVFKGTEITPTSVPVDAVFFNPPAEHALEGGNGYLIPANDLYDPVDPETGAKQPFFGQGTNTFAVDGAGEANHFVIMGGIVSPKGWLVSRHPATITLSRTSEITAIESGTGITAFRK